jgi:hypothetical protein
VGRFVALKFAPEELAFLPFGFSMKVGGGFSAGDGQRV